MSKHILMTGGGTFGPVTPLLAIARLWQKQDADVEISWIGTRSGSERALIESLRIPFDTLLAPKLDRDKPWMWWSIPFLLVFSCIQSFIYLKINRPDIIFTAGGYVSVPVVWMGWLLRIPVWVHQLDAKPGIANKIMAPFATRISVTWQDSKKYFSQKKTTVVGGVVRPSVLYGDAERARNTYGLHNKKLTLLIVGGGTGSQSINEAFEIIGSELLDTVNIIHLTGRGKMTDVLNKMGKNYIALEFLGTGMGDVMSLADIVVSRAGMGTIIELVAMKKSSIIIPLHNFDQINNANIIQDRKSAKILWQTNPQILKQTIVNLITDSVLRQELSRRMGLVFNTNGANEIIELAKGIVK